MKNWAVRPVNRLSMAVAMLLGVAGTPGCAQGNFPRSLYQGQQSMAGQQQWAVDAELASEAAMKNINSRRFDAPDSFRKRAEWIEGLARSNRHADLLQQIVDFRRSRMWNNQTAFNELVDLGKSGDVGAACLAATLYRHHAEEVTRTWRYSFEVVVREALKFVDNGHPVCAGVEGSMFVLGALGYPKDPEKAKPRLVASALGGSYGNAMYLAGMHLTGALRLEPGETRRHLCWQRVADSLSPHAGFANTCEMYRLGIGLDETLSQVTLPRELRQLGLEWCDPTRTVSARTCAKLEMSSTEEK